MTPHAFPNIERRAAGLDYRLGYSLSGLHWRICQTGLDRLPWDPPGTYARAWYARCINSIHPGTVNAFYAATLGDVSKRLDRL